MKTSGKYVLDSFALLAYLDNESGADLTRAIVEHGRRHSGSVFLSVINFGECASIVERERGLEATHKMIAAIEQLPIIIVPVNQERTFAAAHIKAHYKVSYADAFVIALAMERQATVLTGDPEFKTVEHLIAIQWMR